jgi:hypothetical protein
MNVTNARENGKRHTKNGLPPKLNRTTFKTSREMDFFSAKELVTQTGHDASEWPLVIVKELVDNALDACEEADVAPVIHVAADASGISVADNGPGLPEATLQGALDFAVRASNREAYVSPTRGAQGNALMTLVPMPYVLDPEHGRLIVTANGKRHVITCRADPISQRPVVHDDVTEKVKNDGFGNHKKASFFTGTEVRLEWSPREEDTGEVLWPFPYRYGGFVGPSHIATAATALVEGFAVFNPHLTLSLDWFGQKTTWEGTDTGWKKWKPHQLTSPHWYTYEDLARLIGANITHDREHGTDRLLSDFIREFDGLSASVKCTRVLDATGMRRAKLSALVTGDRINTGLVEKLLAAMRHNTKPVNAKRLGLVGEDHPRKRLLAMGIDPKSFRYKRKLSDPKSKKSQSAEGEKASFLDLPKSKKSQSAEGEKACYLDLPGIVEAAFGYLGPNADDCRRIYVGVNWSAAIRNPFRSFGSTGEGLETVLADLRATASEPIVFVLHLAQPRVRYADRGKSTLVIGGAP